MTVAQFFCLLMGVLRILGSDKAPLPISLENHVLQMARGDPGAVYRAAQRQAVHGEVPILPQGITHISQG